MLKTTLRILSAVMLAVAAASCDNANSPTEPILFVGPATLQTTDVRAGTGETLVVGQQAVVHYGLWLYDPNGTDSKGTFVQDSRLTASGASGFTIRIASGSVIQGWVEGLPGMKIGGLRRLIIPPSLAYGAQGNGSIPGNAWLVFDVDLIGIQP